MTCKVVCLTVFIVFILDNNNNNNIFTVCGNSHENFLPYGEAHGDIKQNINAVDHNGGLNDEGVCFKEYINKPIYLGNGATPVQRSIEICPLTPSVGVKNMIVPFKFLGFKMLGGIFYKRIILNSEQIEECIRRSTENHNFHSDWSLVVTWIDTVWGDNAGTKHGTNNFQVVLTSDQGRNTSYVIITYGRMGALLEDRNSASVLIGKSGFSIPGSNSHLFRPDAVESSNVGVPGMWVVGVDERGTTVKFSKAATRHTGTPFQCTAPEEVYEICPDDAYSIDLQCKVGKYGFSPMPSVKLQSSQEGEILPVLIETENDDYVFHFSFFPKSAGKKSVKFVSIDSLDPTIITERYASFNVIDPAHSPMILANGLVIVSGNIKTFPGQRLNVSCGVEEAGSGLFHMTLACPFVPTVLLTSYGAVNNPGISYTMLSSESVSSIVTKELHGTECVCRLQGCYQEDVHFTIHVLM